MYVLLPFKAKFVFTCSSKAHLLLPVIAFMMLSAHVYSFSSCLLYSLLRSIISLILWVFQETIIITLVSLAVVLSAQSVLVWPHCNPLRVRLVPQSLPRPSFFFPLCCSLTTINLHLASLVCINQTSHGEVSGQLVSKLLSIHSSRFLFLSHLWQSKRWLQGWTDGIWNTKVNSYYWTCQWG